jgi:hypothetical protein
MEIGSRRIVHVNVTTNPTLSRVKRQIREATAEQRSPRFLLHDNDGIFGQYGRPVTVVRNVGTRSYRCAQRADPPTQRLPLTYENDIRPASSVASVTL